MALSVLLGAASTVWRKWKLKWIWCLRWGRPCRNSSPDGIRSSHKFKPLSPAGKHYYNIDLNVKRYKMLLDFNYVHPDRSYRCLITTSTAEKWSSCGRDATILSATSRKTSRRPISWSLTSWCRTMSNYSLAEWSSSTIAKVLHWTTSLSGRSPWLKNTCITCRYVSLV